MKNIIIDNLSTTYYITEDGKCYNQKTGKYLKGQENCKNHYFSYNLTLPDGTKKRCLAHRLVAMAFIPNDDPIHKTQINHIDGNKLNNYVDNLEWCTPEENMQHAFNNELKKEKHIFCFNRNKELVAEYKTIAEASRAVNLSHSIIQQEVSKEEKTLSGNFYWSYEPKLDKVKNYKNLGKAKTVIQYDLNGKYINTYESTGVAAKSIGGQHSHIGECCRGKIKSYKGFIWRYAEDIVSTSNENQRELSENS